MDTLISNVTIVTMNEHMDVLFGAYLGIKEGKISFISKSAPQEQPATIIDGTGMVAIPGLINCHTHLATSALRNLLDDESRAQALQAQLQKEDKMDGRIAKAAATISIAECLRFGVTSVSDLYYFPGATAEAADEAGIKANIAAQIWMLDVHPAGGIVAGAGVGMDGAEDGLADIKIRTQLRQPLTDAQHQIPAHTDQVAGAEDGAVIAAFDGHGGGHQGLLHILGDAFGKLAHKGHLFVGSDVDLRPTDLEVAHRNTCLFVFLLV